MLKTSTVLIVSLLLMFGCRTNQPCPDMHFDELSGSNRIVITNSLNKELRVIAVHDEIRAIVAFAQAHDTGWETPWAGTPVAKLRTNFYAGDKFLGDLGIGETFMTAQGCGSFQSREVSPSDREQIMALLGVSDPYAAD